MLADKKCLSFMISCMKEYSLDVMYFDGKSFFEDEEMRLSNINYENAYRRKRSYGLYQNGRELFINFVRNGDYYVQSSLYCLKKEFLDSNHLLFKDGILYEDNLFAFMSMMLAQKVMHQNRTVLLRRIRKGSIMQSPPKLHNFYSLIDTYQKIVEFCSDFVQMDADKEVMMVLNSIKSSAMSVYFKMEQEEKDRLLNLPEYKRCLIKAIFFPDNSGRNEAYIFPYHLFHADDRVVIYGAGNIGKKFYNRAIVDGIVEVVGIVDAKALEMDKGNVPVLPTSMIRQMDYDYVLIAVEDAKTALAIKMSLIQMGISEYKIKWDGDVYFKNHYHRKSHEYQKFANRLMQSDRRKFFLFMLPEHGNLGDYAIAIAEKQFFETHFPEYELIRITTNEWLELKAYFVSNIKQADVLFITGGGFIGDMWESGRVCRDILQAFPQNRKILLPNTLTYYDIKNRDVVRRDLEQIFSDEHTYVFFREKNSLSVCSDLGWGDRCSCFPDMVLYLQHKKIGLKRNGKVLLCFRADAEKVFQESDDIKKQLLRYGMRYDELDTHKYRYIPELEGELHVNELLVEFEKYSLVITDRLHGMLMAYVSGTPCIAFDNFTKKVSGVYEWIKENPDVTFLKSYNKEKMESLIVLYQKNTFFYRQDLDLSKQFVLMKEKIEKLIDEDTDGLLAEG